MVKIPTNPLDGVENLELGCPWITPESCHKLESLIRPTDDVLEFGCGGSTVFFSQLAKSVLSFESNIEWCNKVDKAVKEKDKVSIIPYKNAAVLKVVLKTVATCLDVILIDSAWAVINRDDILQELNKLGFTPRVIVIDNYASKIGSPRSWNLNHEDFATMFPIVKDMIVETFDYQGWGGKGTRIYYEL